MWKDKIIESNCGTDNCGITLQKEKEYDLVVYIGRFQPFHNGHADVLSKISQYAKKTLVIIGSISAPRTPKNPFSFEERKEMITKNTHIQYMQVSGVLDYTYDSTRWIEAVSEIVKSASKAGDKIAIAGHKKDNSSSYLEWFRQWEFIEVDSYTHYGEQVNATDIRNRYFENKIGQIDGYIPYSTLEFMLDFTTKSEYNSLINEYKYNKNYKKSWENAPYPVTFVTTDALVVQSGHILMVQRKFEPGKGLWALPGGFLAEGFTLEESMLKELKEETSIHLQDEVLRRNISNMKVFDAVDRAQRGRVITHVYLIELDDTRDLPKVVGADDAEKAEWVPLGDFFNMRKETFSDHWHIIESMI